MKKNPPEEKNGPQLTASKVLSLLQNESILYYKTRQLFFITKLGKNLLQNASGHLLQNESFLLQNAAVITKRAVFITKRGRYYKTSHLLQYYKMRHNTSTKYKIDY